MHSGMAMLLRETPGDCKPLLAALCMEACMPCLCAALLIRGIDVAMKQPAVLAGHGGSTPLALAVASYRPGEASHWDRKV